MRRVSAESFAVILSAAKDLALPAQGKLCEGSDEMDPRLRGGDDARRVRPFSPHLCVCPGLGGQTGPPLHVPPGVPWNENPAGALNAEAVRGVCYWRGGDISIPAPARGLRRGVSRWTDGEHQAFHGEGRHLVGGRILLLDA